MQRKGVERKHAIQMVTNVIFENAECKINAKTVKLGLCNKDKRGILMQQSALKELYPFESFGKLRIYNDSHVESRRFLAFIPRQGPIYSLKFSTYDDYYKIYINGVKAFMFLDNAIAKNNLTMNHMIYDGMQY
uniref:Uncharacterized protein n=1 Tax=Romanomermis culicivorax TaxID=13658 RepID=A0A915J7Z4_ROMCU